MFEKLFSHSEGNLGRFARFLIFQIRLWPRCIKLLLKNRADREAAVLAYNTILGIVPLAIVMLLIFHALGSFEDMGGKLRNFVYEQAFIKNIQFPADANSPEEKITIANKIEEFTDSFYKNLDKGSLTVISSAFIIWAALALLINIEGAFNIIWGASHGRNFLQRVTNYWAFMTLGPLLFGVAVYVNAKYSFSITESFFTYIGPVVPFLVALIGLFALYMLMPNAKVNAKAAFWGALVAAIVWTAAKIGFGYYITEIIPKSAYSLIYGTLALIPLGVLWIYLTWLIVLFGLQLTYTTQNLTTIEQAEKIAKSRRHDHFLATDIQIINIMKFISVKFEHKNVPVPREIVSSHLALPGDFTDKILNHLVKEGLLVKTSEPSPGFAPATNSENIKLSEILDAVRKASFTPETEEHADSPVIRQIADDYHRTLEQYTVKNLM
ncbi:MAG: hypothetical protein A2Y10_15790 [Planctomycetes bacterium GWF2_41_51]|nr:MAG: hypothetical protein A2Y10_15790 [Planctomycetes bacterium GWF2_41_51]HBG27606.1 hypothetical protein [Phycisphaerales bacterium]